MSIPVINEFLVGYIEGAQAISPDIKVATSYVGSFTDTAKGREHALLLYNSGLSVSFAAAGQSGLCVIDVAAAQGKFVIGVDSDQAEALKDSKPEMANVIITSAMKTIPYCATSTGLAIFSVRAYKKAKKYKVVIPLSKPKAKFVLMKNTTIMRLSAFRKRLHLNQTRGEYLWRP